LITNDANDNDGSQFQLVGEAFKYAVGKPFWFDCKLKSSEEIQMDLAVGLCQLDTTILGASDTDGFWFGSPDADATLHYHCVGASDTTGEAGVEFTTDTYYRFQIKGDAAGNIEYWLDDVKVATVTAGNANLPTTELSVSMAYLNGEAVAHTWSIDYVKCFQIL